MLLSISTLVASVTDQLKDEACPLLTVEGSALKKLIVGLFGVGAGAGAGGGGGGGAAFLWHPAARSSVSAATALSDARRLVMVYLEILPGYLYL